MRSSCARTTVGCKSAPRLVSAPIAVPAAVAPDTLKNPRLPTPIRALSARAVSGAMAGAARGGAASAAIVDPPLADQIIIPLAATQALSVPTPILVRCVRYRLRHDHTAGGRSTHRGMHPPRPDRSARTA